MATITNQDKSKVKDFELDPELDNVDLDALEEEERLKKGSEDEPEDDGNENDDAENEDDNSGDDAGNEEDDKNKKPVDYKEKFANSTREAQVLAEQNKKLQSQLDDLTQPKEATEDELKKEYPSWEEMTDVEKKLAKQNFELRREVTDIKKESNEYVNDRRHKQQINSFIENNEALGDQGVKQLVGREDEFREFAQKNSRKGLEPEVLAKIFLFEHPDAKPVKKKGSLFNSGSGNGNQQKAKKNDGEKITAEQARRIRLTDQRKYQQLVRDGKLDHLND